LSALADQTYPTELIEIVVGDNNSPEGETSVAAVIGGRAKLVVVEERGAGPARNGAVAISTGAVLAFVDADCRPERTWLEEGLRALGGYDFIGGRVTVLVDNLDRMTDAEAFERVFAFDFETYINRKGFTGAGNLFCSRQVFDRVGEFRTGVSEDIEWSQRACAMGMRLGYAPKAIVGHPARQSWDELRLKWSRVNRERFQLAMERQGGRLKWLVQSLALPFSAIAHTPKVLGSDQLSSLRQRFQALRMLFKLRMWRLKDAAELMFRRAGH
jgi:GT2 family glycosyltransferase